MRRRLLPLLLQCLLVATLAACHRSKTPDLLTVAAAPAAPPAPTAPAAAAAPVDPVAPPQPVPTPAATALAIARSAAAPGGGSVAAGATSAPATPCSGLRGVALDACIDREARRRTDPAIVASPAPVASAEEQAFRAAQARRDRALIEGDAQETARLAEEQDARAMPRDPPMGDTRDDASRFDEAPPIDDDDDSPPDDGEGMDEGPPPEDAPDYPPRP